MAGRWLNAPWWMRGLPCGGSYFVVMSIFHVVSGHDSWGDAAVAAGIPALVLSPVWGWSVGRERDTARAAAVGDDRAAYPSAVRALRRGPVPTDHGVRAAAIRLGEYRVERVEQQRGVALPLLAVATVGCAGAAIGISAWWWLLAATLVLLLLQTWGQPRHLRRRLDLLRTAQATAGPAVLEPR